MSKAFFAQDVLTLAKALIGCELLFDGVGGEIVETEAYDSTDPASHSYEGRKTRRKLTFGSAGDVYIYQSYGLHWCMNIVGGKYPGAAVLIRALRPTQGLDRMSARRGVTKPTSLCSGPGNICQALGITGAQSGFSITRPPFHFRLNADTRDILVGRRIGITKATEQLWRFGEMGSQFLSRPFRS